MQPIRRITALAVLALVAGAAPSTASAQELTACYVPKSGTVYRIQVAGAPTKCSQNHVQFSWDAAGSSTLKIDLVQVSYPVGQGIVIEPQVECPAGTEAIGGGYSYYGNLQVMGSNRGPEVNTWWYRVRNNDPVGSPAISIQLTAYCLGMGQ